MQMYNMKKPVIVVILLSIVAAIGLSALDKLGNTRRSIEGLPEPVQTDAIGMVQMTAAGYKIVVSYRYAYDMDVLVAHTKDYFSWDIGDQISPRDLTLIWGKVAQYNSEVDFHWSQMARRTIFALDSSVDTYRLFGGDAEMETCISNNHIIPADDEVRWKLKMVSASWNHHEIFFQIFCINSFTCKWTSCPHPLWDILFLYRYSGIFWSAKNCHLSTCTTKLTRSSS